MLSFLTRWTKQFLYKYITFYTMDFLMDPQKKRMMA